jgi:hypothetical protein
MVTRGHALGIGQRVMIVREIDCHGWAVERAMGLLRDVVNAFGEQSLVTRWAQRALLYQRM